MFLWRTLKNITLIIVLLTIKVMRGGDNQAGFAIRNPQGHYVMPYVWKAHAEFDEATVQSPGTHNRQLFQTLIT